MNRTQTVYSVVGCQITENTTNEGNVTVLHRIFSLKHCQQTFLSHFSIRVLSVSIISVDYISQQIYSTQLYCSDLLNDSQHTMFFILSKKRNDLLDLSFLV